MFTMRMDGNTIDELKQRLADLSESASAIQMAADKSNRDITAEEQKRLDEIINEFEKTDADLSRRKRLQTINDKANASDGRKTNPIQIQSAVTEPRQRQDNGLQNTVLTEKGKWGFAHFGEFLNSVKVQKMNGAVDPRLIRDSATTYGQSTVGEDGGFLIPPDWRTEIVKLVESEDSLLARTDQQTTSSNQMVFPVDEVADWHTNGIRVYWIDEATAATQSKPALKQLVCRANKIGALVYLTDELLEDAPSMSRYVMTKTPGALDFALTDAIINGSGAGKPQGILNGPGLVSVAKETSQVAATVVAENIIKMWSRMPARSRANAVWLINQDLEPLLMQMKFLIKNVAGTENVGGWPLYMPPGGLSGSPYATLLGKPIIPTEACQAAGTKGDIIFADMKGYLTVQKQGGLRADTSIHVEFEKDIVAFRFIMRIGGQPWLSTPIARKNGSNTLSHFVSLDTRA